MTNFIALLTKGSEQQYHEVGVHRLLCILGYSRIYTDLPHKIGGKKNQIVL